MTTTQRASRWMATAVAVLAAGGAAAAEPAARPDVASARLLTAPATPGSVTLEVAPRAEGDPEDAVRMVAVLHGPLAGEGADDLFAFSAMLTFPAANLEFVPGSLRKGDLLGSDGKETLITGGSHEGESGRITIGASRLGRIPGVPARARRATLFSLVFKVKAPGQATLAWEEASFIDSAVQPAGSAQFVGGTLVVAALGEEQEPES